MNVTVSIPNDLAARFASKAELDRRVIEALSLEEYRAGRMTHPELSQVLRFRHQRRAGRLPQKHGLAQPIGCEELDRQANSLDSDPAANDIVARFQAFAADHTLAGLEIKDLISEGRQ